MNIRSLLLVATCGILSTFLAQQIFAASPKKTETINLAVIGDSISVGFNSKILGYNYARNWATGNRSNLESFTNSLSNFSEKKIKFKNYAVPGARMDMISRQLKAVEPNTDLVLVLMGANDLCNEVPGARKKIYAITQKNYIEPIKKAVTSHPNAVFVLIPPPDVILLREVGEKQGCSGKWNLLKICQNILKPGLDSTHLSGVQQNREVLVDELAKLAIALPKNVLYLNKLRNAVFYPQHISTLDCFHPSEIGQQYLADLVWSEFKTHLSR